MMAKEEPVVSLYLKDFKDLKESFGIALLLTVLTL